MDVPTQATVTDATSAPATRRTRGPNKLKSEPTTRPRRRRGRPLPEGITLSENTAASKWAEGACSTLPADLSSAARAHAVDLLLDAVQNGR